MRALKTGNVNLIDAAARELGRIELEDALAILTVLAVKRDSRFEKAAARFAARVTLERRLGPSEAHQVLALAQTMPTAPEAVTSMLRSYCEREPLA